MDITKQWLSQSNGCHKVMDVTKQWLSQSNGCHKDLEGGLARKLCFHIFNFHFLREDSHESFAFTSSTLTFWGKSRTKCVFERMHEMLCFAGQNVSRKMCGEACPADGWGADHGRIGSAVAVDLTVAASFSQLQLSKTEGSLARKRRFHIFKVQIWMEVSHESRTKALFSHLRLSDFEGNLAWKLRFHIFNCRRDLLWSCNFWCRCAEFYCVLQLVLCRSHWNGCVKFAWSRDCECNAIVFCGWTS